MTSPAHLANAVGNQPESTRHGLFELGPRLAADPDKGPPGSPLALGLGLPVLSASPVSQSCQSVRQRLGELSIAAESPTVLGHDRGRSSGRYWDRLIPTSTRTCTCTCLCHRDDGIGMRLRQETRLDRLVLPFKKDVTANLHPPPHASSTCTNTLSVRILPFRPPQFASLLPAIGRELQSLDWGFTAFTGLTVDWPSSVPVATINLEPPEQVPGACSSAVLHPLTACQTPRLSDSQLDPTAPDIYRPAGPTSHQTSPRQPEVNMETYDHST